MNKYIIGDNLHILETLKTNKVQVDLIYFDPPYNTGRDFNDFDDKYETYQSYRQYSST